MMGLWDLPKQGELASTLSLEPGMILVEYNGPQIVLADSASGKYLGVAADEDETAIRWIYAPVTSVELRALAGGAVTTRDVIVKPKVYVVDTDHSDNVTGVWECDAATLDDGNLPDRGALLPKAARDVLLASVPAITGPAICLEQTAAPSKGVFFRALSDVLSSFQRLWNAIAQAVSAAGPKERGRWTAELSGRATLSLAAAEAGSLVMRVEPTDRYLFDLASKPFQDLVLAGSDPQALATALTRLGARVQARYEELLGDVEKHGLQLLTYRDGGVAFLSPQTAGRIRSALPQGILGEPKSRPAVGYFTAFDIEGAKFEFFDDAAEVVYRGSVHEDVLAENNAVAVGPGVAHAVFIEVTTHMTASRHVSETYVLRAIAPPAPPASRRARAAAGDRADQAEAPVAPAKEEAEKVPVR